MMRTTPRREQILELIRERGTVTVEEIARQMQVSAVTIRRDLEQLDRVGTVRRVHGGATLVHAGPTFLVGRFTKHAQEHPREKAAIGRLAATLVQNGETIIIDAGTTTLELARNLSGKQRVTAVCTAVNVAEELENIPGITVMLTGGTMRSRVNSLVNPLLEASLARVYADKVFLALTGLDAARGVSTKDFAEADVKRLLVRAGRTVIALADHSKLGQAMPAFVARPDALQMLITDERADPAQVKALETAGVKVLLAPLDRLETT